MAPDAVAALADDVASGSLSVDNPAVADVTVADFILDGRPEDGDVLGALVDVGINRAIDGASTLTATVTDTDLKLLNSPVLAKAVDLWLDDLAFRLADTDLADDDGGPELVLVFEARAVAKLREFDDPMAASRNDKTRAEFIKAMCDEAGVPFVCPQLHKRQPIKKKTDRASRRKRDQQRDPGIKATAAITVKGQPADSGQRSQIERSLDVAHSLKDANELSTLALLVGGTGESEFRAVPNSGGSNYWGVYQGSKDEFEQGDTEGMAHAFMVGGRGFQGGGAIALAKAHPDWTPGHIATVVEASGEPENFYNVWRDEAEKTLKAYGHGDVFAGAVVEEYAVAYMFRRGSEDGTTKEDSWTCMRRLANEVNWRLWEDAGTVYFMTDDDILRSRVRHTITPGAEGVDSVTGRISTRKPLQEVTVACHARRWAAPPATVVEIEGYGRFDGRWIVATINRPSVFATATTITLHRRQPVKLEPAHDTRTRNPTGGASQVVGNTVAGGTLRDRVVAAAQHAADLSKAHPDYYHYLAGGTWKNDLFLRDAPGERSDCSSFVIQCYAKAGCKLPASMHRQGNTETLGAVGRKVATPKPGDICLYGSAPKYHHVELYVGSGKTIGHGSAPVDADTPRNPALGAFAGYFTFDFLDDDVRQPKANPNLAPDASGQTRPT